MQGIEERARRVDLRPLQVALQELYPRLDACCQSNSVGHLVAVLRESERLDVLYKLLPPIRGGRSSIAIRPQISQHPC